MQCSFFFALASVVHLRLEVHAIDTCRDAQFQGAALPQSSVAVPVASVDGVDIGNWALLQAVDGFLTDVSLGVGEHTRDWHLLHHIDRNDPCAMINFASGISHKGDVLTKALHDFVSMGSWCNKSACSQETACSTLAAAARDFLQNSLGEVPDSSVKFANSSTQSERLSKGMGPMHDNIISVMSARRPSTGYRALGKDFANESFVGRFSCGDTLETTSHSSPNAICPPECPYFVRDLRDDKRCTFICVKAEDCASRDPYSPIAGEIRTMYGDVHKICKRPTVQHCEEYEAGGVDRCRACQFIFDLGADGQCYFRFAFLLWWVVVGGVVAAVVFIVWLLDLTCRPVTNESGLVEGLEGRFLSMLHKPPEDPTDHHSREFWPLTTNLCRTDVAGGGLLLHFNFQAVVIVWALGVGLMWCSLIWFVDPLLAVLGTKKFGTPRQNCILVAWGYETQQSLMWTKIYFLVAVYVFTFVGCLLHGVRQLRLYQKCCQEKPTMQNICLLWTNIPHYDGKELIEDRLKKELIEACGESVVGVSVCWDYKKDEALVDDAVEQFIHEYCESSLAENTLEYGPIRRKLVDLEKQIFPTHCPAHVSREEITKALQDMTTGNRAFVVFETERGKFSALEKSREKGGVRIDGVNVHFEEPGTEPINVYWANFAHGLGRKTMMVMLGICKVLVANIIWVIFFYGPYAWAMFSWSYDNGEQPPPTFAAAFAMIVCVGNGIMYKVTQNVADGVGFKHKHHRDACYMLFYTFACSLNVALDMVTTYYTALSIMKGLDVRTYFGAKLEKLQTFQDLFETYAIQRSLAESAFQYAFPSTFLIPFLSEPFSTIWWPLFFSKLIVRTHKEMKGRAAEKRLSAETLDMGRYADIVLNVTLGILMFYLPGGYTHTLFLAMAACHIFIYLLDHCKVLRAVPSCSFTTMEEDWWSQVILAPCCGLIFSCLVFKANCQGYSYCLDNLPLFLACSAAFVSHTVVHLILLLYFVPLLGRKHWHKHGEDEEPCELTFREINERVPCSWFSSNPIHCLRSKFIYSHSPPCLPYRVGKEHYLQRNEEIGCHFAQKKAKTHDDFNLNDLTDLQSDVVASVAASRILASRASRTWSHLGSTVH